jgi:hypothetical protein
VNRRVIWIANHLVGRSSYRGDFRVEGRFESRIGRMPWRLARPVEVINALISHRTMDYGSILFLQHFLTNIGSGTSILLN